MGLLTRTEGPDWAFDTSSEGFSAAAFTARGPEAEALAKELLKNQYIVIKKCRHGLMMYNIHDLFVGKSLHHYGEWCEKDLDLLRQFISPGDVVLDVGANIGTYTVAFAQMVDQGLGTVYAFEPQRFMFQMLCANVTLNALLKVACFPFAIGDRIGSVQVPNIDPRTKSNFGCMNIEECTFGEGVQMTTIDAFNFRRLNLIKVDVEGMEAKVLDGARKSIQAHRPILFVENGDEEKSSEIIETLLRLGYRCWWHINRFYNPDNFYQNSKDVFRSFGPEANMLCFHQDFRVNLVGNLIPVIGPEDSRLQALGRYQGKKFFIHSENRTARLVELKPSVSSPGPETPGPPDGPGRGDSNELQEIRCPIPGTSPDGPDPASLERLVNLRKAVSLANLHLQGGRLAEAETLFQESLALAPEDPDVLFGLARLAEQKGEDFKVLEHLSRFLRQRPEDYGGLWVMGKTLHRLGRAKEAASYLKDALKIRPDSQEVLCFLGVTLADMNRTAEAVGYCRKALKHNPRNPMAFRFLAEVFHKNQQYGDAEAAVRRAIDLKPDDAVSYGQLANILSQTGRYDEAAHALRKAVDLDPQNHAYRDRFRGNIHRLVPSWHFGMINDAVRNQAYEKAINRAVGPESRVLEIGAGSGLLAMMAARAGAGRVVTCETVKTLASKASAIIAHNGLADRIRVVPKISTLMAVGNDMPEPADTLIMEIFSDELLSEGILPSLEDAKDRLLKPGARIIPSSISVRGMLVSSPNLEHSVRVDRVSGFDLSLFNEFTPPKYLVEDRENLLPRSDPFDIFSFGLISSRRFPAQERRISVEVTSPGRCLGVIQWIHLQLDDQVTYENHPLGPGRNSHWRRVLYTFQEPVQVVPGQRVLLNAEHNRANLNISLDRVIEPSASSDSLAA